MPQQVTIPPDESYVQAVNIIQNQEPKSVTEEINQSTENINNESILIFNPDNTQKQQIQEDVQTIKQDVKTILNNKKKCKIWISFFLFKTFNLYYKVCSNGTKYKSVLKNTLTSLHLMSATLYTSLNF